MALINKLREENEELQESVKLAYGSRMASQDQYDDESNELAAVLSPNGKTGTQRN